MVFSSHLFVFYFLPLALLLYYSLPQRGRHLGLTLSSYLFYGWANPAFVLLMLGSTGVDFLCGRLIAGARGQSAKRWRRIAVIVSVSSNLSLLGFFKYFNFAVENWNEIAVALGLTGLELDQILRVTLPLGISFYTFQSMSYTLDVYRGKTAALSNFIDFACYVSMFPQLVAGPIIRFSDIADQLKERRHTVVKFARGVSFVVLGLAKKILLANPCGQIADLTFDAGSVAALDAWYGVTAYAFQIYFDFSGYSDMAIGLGLMLGFVFAKNFDSPYQAASVTEFWRRWHISLSSWLRDYLYVPLGGNRAGTRRTYFNLMLVMLLGGLWHGAAWNFVVWGCFHGLLLAAERILGKRPFYQALPRTGRVAATFFLVLLSWVFFRASSLAAGLDYLAALFGLQTPQPGARLLAGVLYSPYLVASFVLAGLVTWLMPQTWDFTRRLSGRKVLGLLLLLGLSLAALEVQGYNPFLYFIF